MNLNNIYYKNSEMLIALKYYCIKNDITVHKLAKLINIPYSTLKRKFEKKFINSYYYLDEIIKLLKIDYKMVLNDIDDYSYEYYRNFLFKNEIKYVEYPNCIIQNLFNKIFYDINNYDFKSFENNLKILDGLKEYMNNPHLKLYNDFYCDSLIFKINNVYSLFSNKKYIECILKIDELLLNLLKMGNINRIKEMYEYKLECLYFLNLFDLCINLYDDIKYISAKASLIKGYIHIKNGEFNEAKKIFKKHINIYEAKISYLYCLYEIDINIYNKVSNNMELKDLYLKNYKKKECNKIIEILKYKIFF